MSLRVLHWSDAFWPSIGGVQDFLNQLLPALTKRGVEQAVATSHGSGDLADAEQWHGIPVRRIPFRAALDGRDPRQILQVQKQVVALKRAFRPDLVHVHLDDPSFFFHLQTRAAHPAATLVTVHGEFRSCDAGPGTLLGRLFAEADRVTAVSQALLDDTL